MTDTQRPRQFHPLRPDEDQMPELNPEGIRNCLGLAATSLLGLGAAAVVYHVITR